MKVVIRQPQRRELLIQGDRTVAAILKDLDVNPESHIVIQGKRLLTRDTLVRDEDTVEILSAISGGA